jgi:AraC-like DNA-binding protein
LADHAIDAGYADQSHLTREVRTIMGTTPAQLLRSSPERPIGSRLDPLVGGTLLV